MEYIVTISALKDNLSIIEKRFIKKLPSELSDSVRIQREELHLGEYGVNPIADADNRSDISVMLDGRELLQTSDILLKFTRYEMDGWIDRAIEVIKSYSK